VSEPTREEEAKWVRKKLGLPEDAPANSGKGKTLYGELHVMEAHAHGYERYITAYRCDDKQGEIARQAVQIHQLREELELLRSFLWDDMDATWPDDVVTVLWRAMSRLPTPPHHEFAKEEIT
jgi:hypothetical protein